MAGRRRAAILFLVANLSLSIVAAETAADGGRQAAVWPHAGAPCTATAPRPKMAFLNYFWHRPGQFDCTMLRPRAGSIDSRDTGWGGYYHRRFERLKAHGVDVLGFVFTGFDAPDEDVTGRDTHTQGEGRSLGEAIWLARDVGLPFFIYYDLKVRTAVKSHRCRTPAPQEFTCRNEAHTPLRNYNLKNKQLFEQLHGDLLRIKDDFILTHLDTYYMLEDGEGNPVLDEKGLPRPVLAIYIARNLTSNRALSRLVRRVTSAYRRDGLGRPAFVLDVVWWYARPSPEDAEPLEDTVPEQIVQRFGDAAAAVTSFFPVGFAVGEALGADAMRDWVPHFGDLYARAAAEIADDRKLSGVQVWPGIAAMFDSRRRPKKSCQTEDEGRASPRTFWHLESAEDFRAMLRMAYDSAYASPGQCAGAGPAPQTLVLNYENEFGESAVTDCVRRADGEVVFPHQFGCSLLEVVAEEDRYP